ncbi:MAG: hypothetical protein QNJ73_03805 [Gammaproteobacteria bacterium]|nr:hypothetical protein [Gammaproteobacteria bacterium]
MKIQLALTTGMLVLAAPAWPGAHDGSRPMDHSAHQGHQMTDEQLTTLRRKIPLYREYTDEEIAYGMSRMMAKNKWGWIAETSAGDKVGILTLAHGFDEPANEQFRETFRRSGADYPTTYAFGMAMMGSGHIQEAVTALEDAGAETIIVLPTTTADNSTLIRQWDYIFGKREDSAYLDVPRVQSKARFIWTETPTAHPLMAKIMLDYARENSTNPANELVIIMGHGPQSTEDNAKELEILSRHAAFLKQEGGFMDVKFANVQDDSPRAVRAANVEVIRGWAQAALDAGHEVLVVTTALTQSGVVKRMGRDVDGVAVFNDKGLMQHPRFIDWIDEVVAGGTAELTAGL